MNTDDIVAVQQLLALYTHNADAAKFQPVDSEPQLRLSEVFTDDAVFDATDAGAPAPWQGLIAIRGMFSNPKPAHTPSHMTMSSYIYEDCGIVRAKSKWLSQYWTNDGMRLGEYHDVIVRQGDGWRIKERVIRLLLS